MSTLVERLQAKAPELGQRAIAEMYQNPFWMDRFGARGRDLAEQDGQFHVNYLLQALIASDPGVLVNYARWLQTLLVSRGLCSRHIGENFERLERAVSAEVPDAEPALRLLQAAREALIYESGFAGELQRLAEPLADKAVDALSSRHPAWFAAASSFTSIASFESIHQAERARCKHDVLDHISYLADAIHTDRPELFAKHVHWMRGFLSRRNAPWARVEETLYALDECLPTGIEAATPSHRPPAPGSLGPAEPRASLRPAPPRASLSPPPEPQAPLPMSPELAARARALLSIALQQLASESVSPAPLPGEGVGQ
jgi:hypothetical protein